MRRHGFTLVEVAVAVAVLALAGVALQGLAARSTRALAIDADVTRAMLLAQRLLAEATLAPPEPGTTRGEHDGLRFERDVARTPQPTLREVHVRVLTRDAHPVELVELIHVPPA